MIRTDGVIAGAGIIGLATALELAEQGMRVTVFDRGAAMSESSWAAAGMLAGCDPENPVRMRELSNLSLALYPEFLARIEQLSGERIPLRTTQTLQKSHLLPTGARALTFAEAAALAPDITPGELPFFLLDEHSLDPRDLVRALPAAVRAAGIDLRKHTAVTAVRSTGNSVEIETSAGPISAGYFINATGAWAASLDSSLLISPRKGQMLAVELPSKKHSGETQLPPALRCVLRTPELYIVPRGNGRYVIGATVEDAGFDKQVHPASIDSLFTAAAALWPPLRQASIVETWAGLRPASFDDLPVIDAAGPGIFIAAGHFRNGILLAPATARVLRQLILGQELSVDLSPFRSHRFAPAAF